ncbi:hypothetical protein ALQ35_100431 [Pseudomonas fluorescens]|nr:hypothetical protein ALQ35_100431 [Pseudomonas fluorescens]
MGRAHRLATGHHRRDLPVHDRHLRRRRLRLHGRSFRQRLHARDRCDSRVPVPGADAGDHGHSRPGLEELLYRHGAGGLGVVCAADPLTDPGAQGERLRPGRQEPGLWPRAHSVPAFVAQRDVWLDRVFHVRRGAGAAQRRRRELPGPGCATADGRVGHDGGRRAGVHHHRLVDLHLSGAGHRHPGHGFQPVGRWRGASVGGSIMSLLQVQDLSVIAHNAGRDVTLVDRVSFDLAEGEILGLVGESGSGKTLACRGLMRLLPSANLRVQGGAVRLAGRDLLQLDDPGMRAVRGGQLGMIFQNPSSHLDPLMRIGEQIAEGIRLHQGASKKDARLLAIEVLRQVGIPDPKARVDNYPHEFSGGMRQRAMIAVALGCNPKVLIADEPTTALDVTVQAQILRLLLDLRDQRGLSMIMITHDLGVVAQTCDSIAVMYAGRLCEHGSKHDVLAHPQHPYTAGLIDCQPAHSGGHALLRTIAGQPPLLDALPAGCRFNPRCPQVGALCTERLPEGARVACHYPLGGRP